MNQDDPRPTPEPAATDEAVALTRLAVEAIAEKKGLEPVAMDVAELLQITEVFLVASGTSRRQVQTLADEVREKLRDDAELRPLRVEGLEEGEWVLLDFGPLVVHLFQPDPRAFYDLERLWADAPRVDVSDVA